MAADVTLIQQLLTCNVCEHMHPAYWRKMFPENIPFFAAFTNRRLKNRLQQSIALAFRLPCVTVSDLQHPYRCLLDLSTQQWLDLEQLLGALNHLKAIQQTIQREEKATLVQFLTHAHYDFLIKRGRLYAPLLQRIAVPHEDGSLTSNIQATGRFFLEYLWTDQPEAFVQRFVLVMPPERQWNFRHVVDQFLQQRLFGLCQHLLMERTHGCIA